MRIACVALSAAKRSHRTLSAFMLDANYAMSTKDSIICSRVLVLFWVNITRNRHSSLPCSGYLNLKGIYGARCDAHPQITLMISIIFIRNELRCHHHIIYERRICDGRVCIPTLSNICGDVVRDEWVTDGLLKSMVSERWGTDGHQPYRMVARYI